MRERTINDGRKINYFIGSFAYMCTDIDIFRPITGLSLKKESTGRLLKKSDWREVSLKEKKRKK